MAHVESQTPIPHAFNTLSSALHAGFLPVPAGHVQIDPASNIIARPLQIFHDILFRLLFHNQLPDFIQVSEYTPSSLKTLLCTIIGHFIWLQVKSSQVPEFQSNKNPYPANPHLF